MMRTVRDHVKQQLAIAVMTCVPAQTCGRRIQMHTAEYRVIAKGRVAGVVRTITRLSLYLASGGTSRRHDVDTI